LDTRASKRDLASGERERGSGEIPFHGVAHHATDGGAEIPAHCAEELSGVGVPGKMRLGGRKSFLCLSSLSLPPRGEQEKGDREGEGESNTVHLA
jgi:hypothetical protein